MLDPTTLEDYLAAAEEAARRAAVVLHEWRKRFQVREKSPADLVTDADVASQTLIKAYLQERFPGHGFLGEEGAEIDPVTRELKPLPADAPPTWIVDPIDGTANYVHDVPFYCISIGLWLQGDLRVGVVYDPRMNEMFSAAQGLGAKLNGEPIHVSPITTLRESMLSTGFPADPTRSMKNVNWWRKFTERTQSLRRTGSTALNMAYVAAGRFDAYWAFDNFVWDVAGGVVLVREAGGQITLVDGGAYDPFRYDIIATNGAIHAECLEVLKDPPENL
ncbi:inositol monophosphatase family protein [Tuwongella immobilis]|uniref:Inositol-1-monophosphatase n=1 Tax=Tuwongella immobilis TaxID=692036 RepID=A0A6C2YLG2_9BACT|nr:inositol monophosphatase family protein [Tuwongella immobilis]VIP01752.1 inositol monophosphatase : Inositol monophosphatase OS=Isosphaera pallida (strain ATCC 43644 / DSM 9630 / IS1B) GN=Isop_0533 PE=4 SV=1: Inositol_P [Tuwongella immobilis]VTR99343.1 inositol monophosphatase : Inositol monophosphatase OS=Isosphaera pallida (strain ATCC 43644 / DSM 9630 / IS1B) GN=Isop_0533 PE=4 SV=1: Inositol_P [Tuwongella immobilis]